MTYTGAVEITPAIIAEMLEDAILPYDPKENRSTISFYPGTADLPICTVESTHPANHANAQHKILLRDKTHGLLFVVLREAANRSFLDKIFGRRKLGAWRLQCFGADIKNSKKEPGWQPVQLPVPDAYNDLFMSMWPFLVGALRGYKNLSVLIDPKEFHRLFALTVAKPYIETRESFWVGPVSFAFLKHGKGDSKGLLPLELEIARDFLKPNGSEKREVYHYTLTKTVEDDEFVELEHHFAGAPTIDLLYNTDDYRVERAVRTFRLGQHNLNRAEQALLKGGLAPSLKDEFAIKCWKNMGVNVLNI